MFLETSSNCPKDGEGASKFYFINKIHPQFLTLILQVFIDHLLCADHFFSICDIAMRKQANVPVLREDILEEADWPVIIERSKH